MAHSLTKEAQRARLLALLQDGPVSTSELRENHAIMHPGGRVMELRRSGYNIVTACRHVADSQGVVHRQGIYHLLPGVPS